MPLPRPEDHDFPPGTVIVVPVPSDGLTVYRLLAGEEPRLDDFESRLTRPQAALLGLPDLFRTSVSHWLTSEQAARMSKHRRARVARVELRPHPLVRAALTEAVEDVHQPGHVDVWAPPRELLASVAAVTTEER